MGMKTLPFDCSLSFPSSVKYVPAVKSCVAKARGEEK